MAGVYEKLELLGSGSYGKAWLVNSPKKNKKAVLKEIRLDCLSEKEVGQTLVEVKVLAKCRHVNIVSYCEAFLNSGCLNIVMEYADAGDLQKKILDQKGIHFDNETVLDLFIQICFALKYLHSENILHRDLKPQNLFLTSDGIVKVGDFGIARIMEGTADHALTAIGTPYYLSPEICERKPYNHKSDMWSAGCVLYELCCLHVPFQAPNLPLLVLKIVEGCYDPIPSHYGAVLEDLVAVLLHADPAHRPSAEQVLNIPALQRQVKVTYRRCVSHKQQRHQQRLLSKEVASPSVPNEGDVLQPCCQTYTVKSPLLRRLSVATPKLKPAAKRPRCVQSAQAVSTVKRQRKSSRSPVLNFQKAVLKLSPSSVGSPSCSEYPGIKVSSSNEVPPQDIAEDSEDSDVFEDESAQKAECDDDDVRKGDSPSFKHPKVFTRQKTGESKEPGIKKDSCDSFLVNAHNHARSRRKQRCFSEREGVSAIKCSHSEQPSAPKWSHSQQQSAPKWSHCEQQSPPKSHSEQQSPPKSHSEQQSPPKSHSEQQSTPKSHSEQQSPPKSHSEQQSPPKSHSEQQSTPSKSNTYTVSKNAFNTVSERAVSPEQETYCSACRDKTEEQRCLYQALYTATALSYKKKSAAQRCLSRFLIAHLGSELSLHLCGIVNSALKAGKAYSSVERSLDEGCKMYLPVIFQLWILSGDSD